MTHSDLSDFTYGETLQLLWAVQAAKQEKVNALARALYDRRTEDVLGRLRSDVEEADALEAKVFAIQRIAGSKVESYP